ncbi:MAG: chromosome segregation protein SMC [Dehalococcoidia bacterium]|jgi:chromosome segregation protein
MYLKRLELRGFKSFAAQTVFQFGTGITGVVGPNGVGKSNVADAIRWVLGEQSARTLRARRLEDVIFSGSSQKSPVGMAEVNLVLDNSDGWLPIDFQEVVVGRRAYRDGQGEYLINRNRVRLRDVNDLFLHSELGQGTYAFIGQGLVEEVLGLRPEERRGLIDEAADVRRYRVKLDEARARLVATRDNLERVNLLLSEISPTLARLERQAERADMHARLSRELAQALQAWYGHHWREAQDALTAALAGCDQRQEEFRQAEAEIHACSDSGEALRRAIEERRREIAQRSVAERELSDALRRLEHQCALDEERQRMLGDRLQEIRSDVEALAADRERRQQQETGAGERRSALDREVAERLAAVMACRQELEGAEKERADLRSRAVQAEEQAIRARNVVAEIEARLERVRKTEEGLRQEIEELRDRRKDNLRRLVALAQDYKSHHDDRARIEKELAEVAESQVAVNDAIADTRRSLARAEERVPELQADLQRARARVDILGRVHAEREGFDEATRMLLVAAGQAPYGDDEDTPEPGSLQGYIGVLAGLIRVPPGLEKAIEAALADSLQSIVLASHSDVLAAVQLLMEYPRGRVTLYSADNLAPSRPLVLMQEKGIVGVASDLVTCDARFKALIETLLGRTIVVENLVIGLRVLKRGMGNVATLDGELLRSTGAVTSGSSRTVGALIARESELRRLPAQMSDLEAAVKEKQAEIDGYRRALRDYDAALGAHAKTQQRLWQDRAATEQSFVEHRGHLALLSGQMRELRHQETRAAQTAKQVVAERESLERERDSLSGEAAAAVETAERDTQVIAAVTERLPALTEALTQASSALAAVEGERQALSLRAEEQETALARIDAQAVRKQGQLADVETQMAAASERLLQAQASLDEKRQRWGELTGVQQPGEEELTRLESREKGLRSEMEVALARRRDAEIGLLEAQAAVKQRTDELETLREGMEAEGLTATETGDVVPVSRLSQGLPDWLAGERVSFDEPEDRLPPIRGGSDIDPVALKEQISHLRARIRSLGPVDAQAPADYAESRQRYDFLSGQVADLGQAEALLQEAIAELEEKIKERFGDAFKKVDEEFQRYFTTFFGGGTARLVETQPKEDDEEPGIEIMAQPPGKRVASLSMLSGGERALTAVSLLFALLQTRPSPFCVLDEVDAMLDESNVGRFAEAVKKLAEATQFIIITHNRRTIEMADHIYGVAMSKDMTSSILSLRLSDLPSNA